MCGSASLMTIPVQDDDDEGGDDNFDMIDDDVDEDDDDGGGEESVCATCRRLDSDWSLLSGPSLFNLTTTPPHFTSSISISLFVVFLLMCFLYFCEFAFRIFAFSLFFDLPFQTILANTTWTEQLQWIWLRNYKKNSSQIIRLRIKKDHSIIKSSMIYHLDQDLAIWNLFGNAQILSLSHSVTLFRRQLRKKKSLQRPPSTISSELTAKFASQPLFRLSNVTDVKTFSNMTYAYPQTIIFQTPTFHNSVASF